MMAVIDTQANCKTYSDAINAVAHLPLPGCPMNGAPTGGGWTTAMDSILTLKDGTYVYPYTDAAAGTRVVPPSAPKLLDPSLIQAAVVG